MKPEATTTNELLKLHGPMGSMVRRLYRFALLGWILAFLLFFALFLVAIVDKWIPDPVIAVDESGRVLGTFEYMDSSQRTDSEILAGAEYFVRNFVNVNSATIFMDYSDAIKMMAPDLAKKTLEKVRRTGYLTAIKEGDTESRIEFGRGELKPQIIYREGLKASVWVRGNIVVRHPNSDEDKIPFDLTVYMHLVPRTTLSTHGLQVLKIKEKEIK